MAKLGVKFLFKKYLLIALCSSIFSLNVFAQTIAYVDATLVVEKSPQFEAARKSLEVEFVSRNEDLLQQQKKLTDLESQLHALEEKSRTEAGISITEIRRVEIKIRSHRRNLNASKTEFREDFGLRRTEEFNKLRRQVREVVQEVGKEQKIDLILSDGVVYVDKGSNISNKVLERLIEKFKAKQP